MPKHLRDEEKARKQKARAASKRAKVRSLKESEPAQEKPVNAARKTKAKQALDSYCAKPDLPPLKLPALDPTRPNVIIDFEAGGCLEDLDGILLAILLPKLFRDEDQVRGFGSILSTHGLTAA